MVHGCPAAGISSLAAVPLESVPEKALAIGDARRGSAWWTAVEAGKPVAEPVLLPVSELSEILTECLAQRWPVFSLEPVGKVGLPPEWIGNVTIGVPDAIRVGRAWQALSPEARAVLAVTPVQPVYLRPPHITEAKSGHPLVGRPSERPVTEPRGGV
jgi:tRNA threonylcarbamoyladenosine biosynthesis protein TsaB